MEWQRKSLAMTAVLSSHGWHFSIGIKMFSEIGMKIQQNKAIKSYQGRVWEGEIHISVVSGILWKGWNTYKVIYSFLWITNFYLRPVLVFGYCHCPACRTTLVATRFRVAVICPIIQVPHCIRVFFYFVWFVFINHIFQFYYELCTYCNILDIYLS